MAKGSGLGDNLYIAGYDLSGDIGAIGGINGGPAALSVTPINKSGHERIGGQRDGGIEFTSFFNPATDQAHERLSALPTADVIVSYLRGTTLGNEAACLVAKQIGYDPQRQENGALTFKINALANGYGLEWGRQHTAGKRTDTAATNGTAVDGGAASAFGLQAWLHVFALDGDDVTIKLQESSDDGSSDAFTDVTGGSFTKVTAAPASERIVTARDQVVERYLRVVSSGTFSEATFAVVVTRNLTEVLF